MEDSNFWGLGFMVDPDSELGRSLGLTSDSFSNHYMCPQCGHVGNTETCQKCGSKCNQILY